ncbi:MAG: hypothetical protein LBQ16_05375, partial [Gracilibacteraceae bacterium]|nr:hypothetical protein [Gracilibacteraceae bacterium]
MTEQERAGLPRRDSGRRWARAALPVLMGFALITALLVYIIAHKAADMDFYAAEYAKYGNAAAL